MLLSLRYGATASRSNSHSQLEDHSSSTKRSLRIQKPPPSSSSPSSPSTWFPDPLSSMYHAGRNIATSLCDSIESFITTYVDPTEYPPSQDPKVQLADNFAPVDEFPPTQCTEITGQIPECLWGGAYVRNGSNPLHNPTAGYHYFDGHGMLHAVKFSNEGIPYYCCRFTKTNRYLQDKAAGKSLFPNALGSMSSYPGLARVGLFGMRLLLGLVNIIDGSGTTNAGMAYFDGRLLAMSEDDIPYAVRVADDGDLITVGKYDFQKSLMLAMCAHPKIDPETGELFAFSFNPIFNPHLRYFTSSPTGIRRPEVAINLPQPCLFHDFAITQNYALIPENQLIFNMQKLVLNGKSPITGEKNKIPRFGVLPRYATDDSKIRWFEIPDWTSFHYLNAWEEGEEIIVLSSSVTPVDCLFDDLAGLSSRLTEVHLNLRTGMAYKQHVCSAGIDFGQINQKYTGRKNRYTYMCYYGPWPKFSGLAKIDLAAPRLPRMVQAPADPDIQEPCIVASRRFKSGCFCSEPFFVSRSDGDPEIAEDDGYVLTYVHDENTGISELLIMDAKSSVFETVSSIRLPGRVPYGFHGIFLSPSQVANQNLSSL